MGNNKVAPVKRVYKKKYVTEEEKRAAHVDSANRTKAKNPAAQAQSTRRYRTRKKLGHSAAPKMDKHKSPIVPGESTEDRERRLDRERRARMREENPEKASARREATKKWHRDNPAHTMLMSSRRLSEVEGEYGGHVPIGHGLSYEDAIALIQSWLDKKPDHCEFCGRTGCKLFLDHNHKTGAVRAWLCAHCNAMEGHIATGRMQRLADFIRSRELSS